MYKKSAFLFAGLFLIIVLASYLVSAQSPVEDIKALVKGVGEVLTGLFETILGPGPEGAVAGGAVDFLFARALFLLLIFVIVWAIVSKVPIFSSSTWMIVIVSGAVALLSTRFLLQPGWVETILLPYSAFGIAITALLPLLLYFYFVESAINSRTLRKIAWIFAAVVFVGLWWSRYGEIRSSALFVYPVSAVFCMVFLLADGTIQKLWAQVEMEKNLKPKQYILYNDLLKDIERLIEAQTRAPNAKAYKDIQTEIDNKRKQALKMLKNIS